LISYISGLFGVSKVQQIVPILNAVYQDKSSFKNDFIGINTGWDKSMK
jgi:hypothetical protein